jgi:hypothetical protein
MSAAETEAEFQAKVVELAKATGWQVYHTYDSRRSNAGWPDLALVRGVSMLFLELKSEEGKVTTDQQRWIISLKRVKFVTAAIARPHNWDEIAEMLKGAAR